MITTDSTGTIYGGDLLLISSNGTGASGTPILTNVTNLAANVTSGQTTGIYVQEANAVTVTTVTSGINTSLTASGLRTANNQSIWLNTTAGSISVVQAISAHGTGDVTLTANGAASDLSSSDAGNISTGGGNIDGTAGDDVSVNTTVTSPGGWIVFTTGTDSSDRFTHGGSGNMTSSNGTIVINANNIELNATSSMDASAGILIIRPTLDGQLIDLGGTDVADTLALNQTEFDTLKTTGTLVVGSSEDTAAAVANDPKTSNTTGGAQNAGTITLTDNILVSSNITNVLLITEGAITDGGGAPVLSLASTNTLTLDSDDGISGSVGTGATRFGVNVTNLAARTRNTGAIRIHEANDVTVNSSVGLENNFDGILTASGSSGDIDIEIDSSNNTTVHRTLLINQPITADGAGEITIDATEDEIIQDVSTPEKGNISSTTGDINITFGSNNTFTGNQTFLAAGITTNVGDAGGDVYINFFSNVIDNNSGRLNIRADTLTITDMSNGTIAKFGLDGDKLELEINTIQVGSGGSVGELQIENDSDLTVGAVTTTRGGVEITVVDGSLTFSGNVTVAQNYSFLADADAIRMEQGLNLSATNTDVTATFRADEIDFTGGDDRVVYSGAGTATGILSLEPRTLSQDIQVGGNSLLGQLHLDVRDLEALGQRTSGDTNWTQVVIGREDGTGTITFTDATTFTDPLKILAAGSGGRIVVNAPIQDTEWGTNTDLPGIHIIGSGSTTVLNANNITAGAAIVIDDSVELDANITLDTTSGGAVTAGEAITITGTVDSVTGESNSLTADAGTDGDFLVQGNIGATEEINALNVTANDADFDGTLAMDGNLTVLAQRNVGTNTDYGDVTFDKTATAGGSVGINQTGILTIAKDANFEVDGFDQAGSGTVRLGATIATSNDTVEFDGSVTLISDAAVHSSGTGSGNITFNDSIDGDYEILLNAGNDTITIASVQGVGSLIIESSGNTTITGSTVATAVDLQDTVTDITFNGTVTATSLTTASQGYQVLFNDDVTITNAVTFSNTGNVTFGDSIDDVMTFIGGVSAVESESIVQGTIRTDGTSLTLDEVTLSGNATFATDNNAPAGGTLSLGAINGSGNELTVDGGTGGAITVASITNTSTFTVTDSGSLTVTGTTDVTTLVLTDTTGAAVFEGTVAANTLTTQAEGYSLTFKQNVTIQTDTTLQNVGGLTLGDSDGDVFTFVGGLDTGSGGTTARGSIVSTNTQIDIGTLSLSGNLAVDTGTGSGDLSLGAVTGGDHDLTLDVGNNVSANITVASVSGVDTLTITDSGSVTVTGAASFTALNVVDTTTSVIFSGAITATSLTFGAQPYLVALDAGGTITDAVTFANTGGVRLGDGSSDVLTFVGGVSSIANTTTVEGVIRTDGTALVLNATTLGGHATLATDHDVSAGGTLTLGAATGDSNNLTLDGGTSGVVTVASLNNVSTLTVSDSGSTTVTGAVTNMTTVRLDDTTGRITFQGEVTANTLITAQQGYSVEFDANTTITDDLTFRNTGGVFLGDGDGDDFTFTNGLDTRAGATTARGTIVSTNTAIDLGTLTLSGDLEVDTGTGTVDLSIGAVTGADNNLTVDAGSDASAGITLTSLSGVDVFTVRHSGSTMVTGTTSATTVTLTNTTGAITFQGAITADTLNAQSAGYSVAFEDGGTITNDVDFANTGGLTFGDADTDVMTFDGGVNTTASTTTARGTVRTSGDQMEVGALTLSGDLILATDQGVAAGNVLNVGAVTGGDNALTIDGGIGGDATLASVEAVSTLTIRDSGNFTVTGATTATTATLLDTTGAINFAGAINVTTLNTADKGYSVLLPGGGKVTNAVTFSNTGGLTLGDEDGDVLTFVGGITATESATTAQGTVRSDGKSITLDEVTLSGNATFATDNNAGAGAALTLGAINSTGNELTVDGGTGGAITVASITNTSTFTVTDSGTLTVTGTTTATEVNVADTTDSVTFQGAITANTLTTTANAYSVVFEGGGTIQDDTTFLSTGGVTFGDEDGDTMTFVGGLDTQAGTTIARGTVRTGGNQMDIGALTLSGGLTLATDQGVAAGAVLNLGAVTGDDEDLTLDGGTGGDITVASLSDVDGLTVTNSGNFTVTGATEAESIALTNTTAAVIFAGEVTATSLTTTAQGYSVALEEGGTITNLVTFLNTGGVTLGDESSDVLTFVGGASSTANTTTVEGVIRTEGTALTLNATTLGGDAVLMTDHDTPAGGALTLGAVTGDSNDLTLDGGTAGVLTVASINNVTTVTVSDSGRTTVTGVTENVTTMELADTSGAIRFGGSITATRINTTAQAYSVEFGGDANITEDLTFRNTGGVTLGDSDADDLLFQGGLDTSSGATTAHGTVRTAGEQIDVGSLTLDGDTTISTGTGADVNLGAVTGASNNLTLNGNTTGALTVASVAGVDELIVAQSNATTVTGTTSVTTLTLSDTEGAVTFEGSVTAGTLTTAAQTYSVVFEDGGTITADANFDNTGGVTFGDADTDVMTFDGGLNTTLGTTTARGTVRTSGDQMDLGALTLAGDLVLATDQGVAAGNVLNVGAVTGGDNALTIDGGIGGDATLASVEAVSTLTIRDSGNFTVTGATTATTATLLDTTGAINFAGAINVTTLNTADKGYSVLLPGGGKVTNAVTFSNTGGLTLGDEDGDVLTFVGGITATESATTAQGTVRSDGKSITLDEVTLSGNATFATDNNAGAGAALTLGAINSTGNELTVDGGTGGAITVASITNTSTFTVTDSGSLTVTGTTDVTTLVLTDTTGAAVFEGTVAANTLTTQAEGYSLTFKQNVTIQTDTTLENVGGLTLGDSDADVFAFVGGLDTRSGATTARGSVVSTNTQIDIGTLSLAGNLSVDTGTADANLSLGAVTGNAHDLTLGVGNNASAAITVASLSGVDTLTITNSGTTAVTGAASLTSLNVVDTTTSVIFSGAITATSLVFGNTGYLVALDEGGTITDAVTFANTGGVRLGDGSSDVLTFVGGVSSIANTTTVEGVIRTDGTALVLNATTLGGHATLATDHDVSAGGTLTLGAVTGDSNNLTLDGGTSGVVTVASLNNVSTLTVSDSGSTTVTGAVTNMTTMRLDDTTGRITFQGEVTANTLITAQQGYSVEFDANTTITDDLTFRNTGGVFLGDGDGDDFTFTNGLDTRAGATTARGTIVSTNTAIDLGTLTLSGDLEVDTGTGTVDLSIGAVTGADNNLTVDAGSDASAGITLTSLSGVDVFTVRHSGSTMVTGTTSATTVTLTNTTGAITFQGAITADTLNAQSAGYSVAFEDGGTITNDVDFANTGGLTFGDADTDVMTFSGGVNTTTSTTTARGTVQTSANGMDLGTLTITGALTLSTGNTGGDIAFSGNANGSTPGVETLLLNAGSGTITLQDVGDTVALKTFRAISSNAAIGTRMLGSVIRTRGSSTIDLQETTLTLNNSVTLDTTDRGDRPEGADIILGTVVADDSGANDRDLTLVAGTGGVVSLDGNVGAGVNNTLDLLTVTSAKQVEIAGSQIVAGDNDGGVNLPQAVILQADVTINTSASNEEIILGAVDSDGNAARDLTITTGTGSLTVETVGGAEKLDVLDVDAGTGSTVTLNGDITANNFFADGIAGTLSLGADVAVTVSDTDVDLSNATVSATAAGVQGLTISASTGTVTLNVVGDGANRLEYLTVTTKGQVSLEGNIDADTVTLASIVGGVVVDDAGATTRNVTIDISGAAGDLNLRNTTVTLGNADNLFLDGAADSDIALGSVTDTGANSTLDVDGAGTLTLTGHLGTNSSARLNTLDVSGLSGTTYVDGTSIGIYTTAAVNFSSSAIQGTDTNEDSLTIDSSGDVTLSDVGTQIELRRLSLTSGGAIEQAAGSSWEVGTIVMSGTTGVGNSSALQLSVTTINITTTDGDINVTNDATTAVEAELLQVTGNGTIVFEQTGRESLVVVSALTGNGSITLRNEGDTDADVLRVTSAEAGGVANVTLETVTAGNIELGSVTASDDTITVTSAGAIDEDSVDDADVDLTATTIDLNAVDGIGGTRALELRGLDLSADSTGTGSVRFNVNATAGVNVTSATSGTGDVAIVQVGGQLLNVTTVETGSGSIAIENTAGELQVDTGTAGGAGDLSLETVTSGNISFNVLSAEGDSVTVTASNEIRHLGAADAAVDVNASVVDLNAADGIGDTNGALDVTATTIRADSTGTGSVALNSLATGAVTVTSLSANVGSVTLNQTGNESLTVTLAQTLNGTVDVVSTGDTDADVLTVTEARAGGSHNLTVTTVGAGDVALGLLDADGDTVTVLSAGDIDVTSDDVTVDLLASTVSLTAADGIGGDVGALDVRATTISSANVTLNGDLNLDSLSTVGTGGVTVTEARIGGNGTLRIDQTGAQSLTVEQATTGNGTITLTNEGDADSDVLTVGNATAGGTGEINVSTVTEGNVSILGSLNAAGDTVTVTAAGALVGADGGLTDVIAGVADLDAADGLTVEVTATTLSADSSGTGAVSVESVATGNVTVTSVSAGTGDVTLLQTGNFSLLVESAVTSDGSITLNNTGNSRDNVLTVRSLVAGGSDSDVRVESVTAGNILLDRVEALGDTVTVLTGNGTINEYDVSDSGAEIVAQSIDLDATVGIGDGSALELTGRSVDVNTTAGAIDVNSVAVEDVTLSATTGVGTITVDGTGLHALTIASAVTSDGSITLTNAGDDDGADALTLTNVTAGGAGDIHVTTTGSSDVVLGALNAVGDDIRIDSSGSITDGNLADETENLIATDLYLTAEDEIGGVAANADLDTWVTTITASSTEQGGITLTETDAVTLVDVDTQDGSIVVAAGGNVTATDVASLTDRATNNITITATAGNITAETIDAQSLGAVTLSATTGAILDDAAATLITGGRVTLTAADGIGENGGSGAIDTSAGILDASVTGIGNITIMETDSVTLEDVDTADGSINITTGGDTVVTDVASLTDTEDNDIRITATVGDLTVQRAGTGGVNADLTIEASAGSILDAAPDTAADRIIGDVVTLIAGNGIGAEAGNGAVQTQAVSLNMHVTTDGAIVVNEADDVNLGDVDTADGSITITTGGNTTILNVTSLTDSADNDIRVVASNGSINVSVVDAQAKGGVELEATLGAVTDDASDTTVITGDEVLITAHIGIGAPGNEIDTTASRLDLSVTGSGNIDVIEADAVTLADVDTADGSIRITTGGDTFVTDVESVTDADANDITINATDGSITVQRINGGGVASDVNVISVNRSILDAASDTSEDRTIGDVVTLAAATGVGADEGAGGEGAVATEAKTLNVSVTDNGSIFLAEVDSVNLELVQSQNGSITVSAGGDTIATNVSSLTDADANDISLTVATGSLNVVTINAGGTNGDVSLLTTTGAIVDDATDSTVITADVLRMTAGTGIGANDEIDTTIRTLGLAQVTGTGSIAINETDSLTLDTGDVPVNDVVLTSDGDFSLGAAGNVAVNDNIAVAGDVDMSNVTIDIQINRSLRISGDGTVNLRSDAGGTLIGDSGDTTEALTISAGKPAAGGPAQILLGNVGRGTDEYVNLSFVPTDGDNSSFDDPQNENVINLRLDGTMQFDASGLDARNVRQVILDGDVSINSLDADVLFTNTPIEAASAGNQTLTVNAGTGIVDFYIVGCTEYLNGSPINVTDGVPLGGLNVTASLVRLAGNVCTNDGPGGGNITVVADNVELLTDLAITSDADDSGTGGAINFLDAPINGNFDLVVDSGNGNLGLTDVGQTTRLESLTVRGTGNTTIGNGPTELSTLNDINFTGAPNITLGGNLTADSAQGSILLDGGEIDGAVDLSLTALQTVQLGGFGQTAPPNDVTVTASSLALSGNQTASGDVTLNLRQSVVNDAVLVSQNGTIYVVLLDSSTGFAQLLPGSVIRAENGTIFFSVPFEGLLTRGDLAAPGGHEFFNLLGLPSFSFDAEQALVGLIPRVTYQPFVVSPTMYGQFLEDGLQWKETILPAELFLSPRSKVRFEDEEGEEE